MKKYVAYLSGRGIVSLRFIALAYRALPRYSARAFGEWHPGDIDVSCFGDDLLVTVRLLGGLESVIGLFCGGGMTWEGPGFVLR